jgi:hypothetical protein
VVIELKLYFIRVAWCLYTVSKFKFLNSKLNDSDEGKLIIYLGNLQLFES